MTETVDLTTRAKKFLIATFLFFYVPVAYHLGFNLIYGILLDFPSYYYAAQLAFTSSGSPYGFEKFQAVSAMLGRKVHPFLYPPYSLIAFWPFLPFTIQQAQSAFLVLSHLCFLGSLWLILFKITPVDVPTPRRELVIGATLVYVMVFDPALSTLAIGQINLIVLFFMCLALAAIKHDSAPWRIGLPLSLAILLKTYPVLLVLLLLFRRQFKAAFMTLAFLGSFILAAVASLRSEVWRDWFTLIAPFGRYGENAIAAAYVWNQSLNGFVTRLVMPSVFAISPLSQPSLAAPVTAFLAAMVTISTLGLSLLLARRPDCEHYHDDEMSVYLLMIFLVAPLSWDHHLVYTLPALAVVISRLISEKVTGVPGFLLLLSLFILAWKVPLDHPLLHAGWWVLLSSIKLYPVLILWLYFVTRLARPLISARLGRTPITVR